MNKYILTLTPHSFVDLITNSSSELFVCDTNKSLTVIKDIIVEILTTYNRRNDTSLQFDDVFDPPALAEYTFDHTKIPSEIWNKYILYNDRNPFDYNFRSEVYDQLCHAESMARNELYTQFGSPSTNTKTFDQYDRKFHTNRKRIWSQFSTINYEMTIHIFIEFLKQNNFDPKYINRIHNILLKEVKTWKNKIVELWPRQFTSIASELKKNPKLDLALQNFNYSISYGIDCNKHTILVKSKYDNSIPYDVIEAVECTLGCRRFHI